MLADDHTLVLEGLSKLLQKEFDLVGTASSGAEAVEMAATLLPDVVLMDISMPGLTELMPRASCGERAPKVKVVAVTMHNNTTYVREAMKAGMAGYVLKQSAASELAIAVHAVMRNDRYITPALTETGGRNGRATAFSPAGSGRCCG